MKTVFRRIGFAMTGSFCTHREALEAMGEGRQLVPLFL